MALIREVKQHENGQQWAYVEFSDENKNHFIILGNREFPTKEEAVEYSKGFDPFSYQWVEPLELEMKNLIAEETRLKERLKIVMERILTLQKNNN